MPSRWPLPSSSSGAASPTSERDSINSKVIARPARTRRYDVANGSPTARLQLVGARTTRHKLNTCAMVCDEHQSSVERRASSVERRASSFGAPRAVVARSHISAVTLVKRRSWSRYSIGITCRFRRCRSSVRHLPRKRRDAARPLRPFMGGERLVRRRRPGPSITATRNLGGTWG